MPRLAIHGGNPVRTIHFPSWPIHDEQEVQALTEVCQSGKWWRGAYSQSELGAEATTGRSRVEEFEKAFASHHGTRYAVGTSNGSGALDIALKSIGVGPGDEVIVPPYTFVATATSVLHCNAVPVFTDIDTDTYNLDPRRVEDAITEHTRAIVPVHFGGILADMEGINTIAKKYNLKVVEDAAHAHGVEGPDGKKAGSYGDIGMFSFQQSKNMTAGEGGAIITSDRKLYELCYSYHHYGREEGHPWYEIHRLGWNARMLEFQAAVLLVQLQRLDEQNARRAENARYLTENLQKIKGIEPVRIDFERGKPSIHLFIFKYDKKYFDGLPRDLFLKALHAEGIPATGGYTYPIYNNPAFLQKHFYPYQCPIQCSHNTIDRDYASFQEKCPVTEKACKEEAVWLTQNMFLGDHEDMDDIVEGILKIAENKKEFKEYPHRP